MKKRVAIPLSIFLGLVFWFIVAAIIGSRMEPVQRQQQAEQPKTANQSIQEPEPEPQQSTIVESEPKPALIDRGTIEPEEANVLPGTNQVQAPITPLFDSVRNFRTVFNQSALKNSFNFQLPNIGVQNGEANNMFQCKFTNNLGIVGTVDKTNNGVKEITMIGSSDGTLESSTNLILCMAVIIASVDPSLLPEQRGDVLRELGFFGADNTDIMNLSTKTEKNRLQYFINSSPQIGIIFGVSRK
jgi:hypothetical protein